MESSRQVWWQATQPAERESQEWLSSTWTGINQTSTDLNEQFVCLCSVTQSRLTLLWPRGLYSLRVFFVYGILQVRILECVAISSYRGPSWPMNQTHVSYVSCIAGGFFTAEPLGKPKTNNKDAVIYARECGLKFTCSVFSVFWHTILKDTLWNTHLSHLTCLPFFFILENPFLISI